MDLGNRIDFYNCTFSFLKENQDYLWLKTRVHMGKETHCKNTTLITGSSHALNGVDVQCFENAINCSMHTQDIYYDYVAAKTIIDAGNANKFSRCYIVLGYYIAFQDVSRSENVGHSLIRKIYLPLYKDVHNWTGEIDYNLWESIPCVRDEEMRKKIEEESFGIMMRRKQYYSDLRARRSLFDFCGKEWKNISPEAKEEYGKLRAQTHNKLKKHKESFLENQAILLEYISFLDNMGIRPIILIPPFTDSYNKYVDREMKDSSIEMIKASGVKDLLDINDFDFFSDADFLDTDHLNARGAYKMSCILTDKYGM